jgi:MYXO-CTERM domain-containing protein
VGGRALVQAPELRPPARFRDSPESPPSAAGGGLSFFDRYSRGVPIFNRRNALLGWAGWLVGKRVLKRKAKAAVPAVDPETKRPNRSAVAFLLAAAVGVGTFWRRRRGDEE